MAITLHPNCELNASRGDEFWWIGELILDGKKVGLESLWTFATASLEGLWTFAMKWALANDFDHFWDVGIN